MRGRTGTVAVRVALFVAMILQTYLLYFFTASDGEVHTPQNTDKLVHMAMFGGPALLALVADWPVVAFALVLYAPMSEVIQAAPWVGRDGDWHDAAADVTGIIAAAGVWRFVRRR